MADRLSGDRSFVCVAFPANHPADAAMNTIDYPEFAHRLQRALLTHHTDQNNVRADWQSGLEYLRSVFAVQHVMLSFSENGAVQASLVASVGHIAEPFFMITEKIAVGNGVLILSVFSDTEIIPISVGVRIVHSLFRSVWSCEVIRMETEAYQFAVQCTEGLKQHSAGTEHFQQMLQEKYGLSEAEAGIAGWFSEGLDAGTVARKTGYSTHTVYSYLRRLYRVLGISKQAQLTSVMLNLYA